MASPIKCGTGRGITPRRRNNCQYCQNCQDFEKPFVLKRISISAILAIVAILATAGSYTKVTAFITKNPSD